MINRSTLITYLFLVIFMALSCTSKKDSNRNPIEPSVFQTQRQGMNFYSAVQIFGDDPPAGDVDLASVVWGDDPQSTYSGDIVEFDYADESTWAVAVAIVERPGPPPIPPNPYVPPTHPVLRFLSGDGETTSGIFGVPVSPAYAYGDLYYCRIPRVDCIYRPSDHVLEVNVAYRYGKEDLSLSEIRVTQMYFEYKHYPQGWRWLPSQSYSTNQLADDEMTDENAELTHPDIAIDHDTGDIYCAYTDLSDSPFELKYKRYDGDEWTNAHLLTYDGLNNSAWYVNLDIGEVDGVPDIDNGDRIVAFTYTGWFRDNDPPYNNCYRPVVGYWSIANDQDPDGDHPAQYVIITSGFTPGENAKYMAGLSCVDIPSDRADPHGVSLTYIQDTGLNNSPDYQVYGISSLYWGSGPTWGFVHISVPTQQSPEFDQAVLPSVVVHNNDGAMASVTYFASLENGQWRAYATLWTLDDGTIADPTVVYYGAHGEFEMDANDFISHDWGTASSLVLIDNYGSYWAAWSDKLAEEKPVSVWGAMGYTE